ncbi:MAG: glycosyltransferase family 2 protein [Sulfuricellaceae bacterium]|nr:glycosyltransferase family 2 protein [Sulfuricellaceae bacterium]
MLTDSAITSAGNFLELVTPIILTYNEAPNIRRSLARLQGFDDVLIVDSGSSDETLAIVAEFANARVLHRPFDSFSGQWNFALREGGLRTEWALAMDADYILTDDFLNELGQLAPSAEAMAYRIAFDYSVFGKTLSATLYPPIIVLYRHRHTHYIQDGHCMRAQVPGVVGELRNRVLHDDRKPLSRWLASQSKYADQESELLLSKAVSELRIQDRLRRMMVITPWLVPLYCLTVGRGALDGWAGIYYALQRGVAETLLALKLIERKLERGKH